MNTLNGGTTLRQTMIKKYGSEEAWRQFMRDIGSKGGSKGAKDGAVKGFAAMPREKRVAAGRKGGAVSKRGPYDSTRK